MKKLNAAVVGVGMIGRCHIEALRRIGCVNVMATMSRGTGEAARKKADGQWVEKAYNDYAQLCADPEIDVVHICTPNNQHFEQARLALLSGKHVVCEKPLCMTSGEAEQLAALAREKGLVNAVHYNKRFYPMVREAKALVDSGELGEITGVSGSYLQDWLLYDTDYSWRVEAEYSGSTRAISDIGTHWFDLVEFVTGLRIKKLCADFHTIHKQRKRPGGEVETYANMTMENKDYDLIDIDTEDYGALLLRFDNGARGTMLVNQAAAGHKNNCMFNVFGTKKSISWNEERENDLWIGSREDAVVRFKDPSQVSAYARELISYPGGHDEGYNDTSKQMFKKIYACITDGDYNKGAPAQFPVFEDGLREMKLCEYTYLSAKGEKWVDVR